MDLFLPCQGASFLPLGHTVGLMIYTAYILYPYTQMPSHAHTTVSYAQPCTHYCLLCPATHTLLSLMHSHAHTTVTTVSYTRFVAKSSVERIEIVRKEVSDLLQALDLELLRFLLNHLPGWHNKTVVTLPCTANCALHADNEALKQSIYRIVGNFCMVEIFVYFVL